MAFVILSKVEESKRYFDYAQYDSVGTGRVLNMTVTVLKSNGAQRNKKTQSSLGCVFSNYAAGGYAAGSSGGVSVTGAAFLPSRKAATPFLRMRYTNA